MSGWVDLLVMVVMSIVVCIFAWWLALLMAVTGFFVLLAPVFYVLSIRLFIKLADSVYLA